ncbi:hypothetical protein M433DRAFT_262308 [Acidomyces richmondensis BFW]|nr:MAG: hypothetical protein FE78DRAFT_70223 [Acidomyces sp. 'richmondensis']KYG45302.1 hypothetical protein M433DRAFT_262308 [Acidomyces richmondensis BFW]
MTGDLEFPALPPPSRTTPLSMDDSTAVPATIPSRRSIPPSRQASIQLDDFSASRRSTPPVPPGFEAVAAALNESRRSTPTIPPGFERISAVPGYLLESAEEEGIGGSRPSSRASLRKVGSLTQQQGPVLPALPLRPVTPAKVGSKCGEGGTPTKVGGARDGVITEEVKGDKDVEEYSITKDMAKENEEPDVSPQTPAKGRDGANVDTNTGQEDWSKANATTPTSSHTKVSLQPAAKGQATVQVSDARATPVTPSKTEGLKKDEGSRRKHPGKLDITAAVNKPVDSSTKMSAANETSVKVSQQPQRSLSQTSKPESPNVASSSSPIVKTAPRTLRVIQTPKAETPPLQPSTSTTTSNTLPVALTGKILSRKPSVASMIVPGTPSSEQVSMSDNLSLTSTSQSRTSSPPPSSSISAPAAGGKVGSAPVRAKTKSQMKKERQERAKALQLEEKVRVEASTAAAEDTKPVQPLPQQEAIISRKKKTKKEKAAVSKMPSVKNVVPISEGTAPTVSRPSSPPAPTAAAVGAKKPAAAPEAEKPATPTKPAPGPVYGPPPPPASSEPSPPPTPPSTLTAAALLADLKASTPEIQKCLNALFRTPTSAFFKPPGAGPTPADLLNNPRHPTGWASEFLPPLTREDVDGLLEGRLPAVRYGGDSDKDAAAAWWDRGMVTSSGTHLRALTAELEERFLVLERALGNIPSDARWRPTKPQNDMRFPRVDLEGLRRGWEERGVSAMERMVQDGAAMKKGAFLVDEAARYLDEFVMPPATPPPATQGPQGQESKGDGKVGESGFLAGLSLEVLERQLQEVRRMSEEREGQLRKMIKKNRRVLGLG